MRMNVYLLDADVAQIATLKDAVVLAMAHGCPGLVWRSQVCRFREGATAAQETSRFESLFLLGRDEDREREEAFWLAHDRED